MARPHASSKVERFFPAGETHVIHLSPFWLQTGSPSTEAANTSDLPHFPFFGLSTWCRMAKWTMRLASSGSLAPAGIKVRSALS